MQRVTIRVRADSHEDALDGLLALLPDGIHERPGDDVVELFAHVADDGGADIAAIERAAGPTLVGPVTVEPAPAEVTERRRRFAEPLLVADRFVLRGPYDPPAAPGLIGIEIAGPRAFGTGAHPTTRMCLELLAGLEPAGGLADLGCGSGVLSIGALALGWSPVISVDHDTTSVQEARANGERNGVRLDARVLDLLADPLPEVAAYVANVPATVHERIATALPATWRALIVSGLTDPEADAALADYTAAGARVRERRAVLGWTAALLEPAG
jgi:ribosomal protein L11 methyltransferase